MLKDFRILAAIVLLALAGQSSGAQKLAPVILGSFSGADGSTPEAALVEGSDSNFYGTTFSGGTSNTGTVFQITAAGTLTTLHHFNGADGAHPSARLVEGSDSNFYGTTFSGGTSDEGTVFQISSAGTLTTLYDFGGRTNGANPHAGLVQGSDGFFYGTTSKGRHNGGTVFKISSSGTLTPLFEFSGSEGSPPISGLVEGSDGYFYGMATGGGDRFGTVFRISSVGVLSRLYSFAGGIDGGFPYAGLILGGDGSFYGTTAFGGQNLHGVVFKIKGFPSGTYSGLAIQTNASSHASSGFISLVVDDVGLFVAKLTMGGVRSSFKGRFDASGVATNTIRRKNLNTLQTVLHVNEVGGTNDITGTVSDGVFTSDLLADLGGVFSSRTNACPFTGRYTFVWAPADSSDTSVPQGYGYSALTVTKNGSGRLQGVLGDGTKIKATVPVSAIGTWPLYNALYKRHGSCLGWITLSTNSVIDVAVDWFKPPVATDHFYPAGFTTSLLSTGAFYIAPAAGGPSIAGSGTLTLGGGNLASNIVKSVVVNSNGTVVVSPPGNDNLALQIAPKTGQFSGNFLQTTINKTVTFNGLLLQIDKSGAGFFLGTSQSGFVTIEIP